MVEAKRCRTRIRRNKHTFTPKKAGPTICRSDLMSLIYAMEHDPGSQPHRWQIVSLKSALRRIDHDLHSHRITKGRTRDEKLS